MHLPDRLGLQDHACALGYHFRSLRVVLPRMKQTFLDFEQPLAELHAKIDELRYVHEDSAVDISDEINRLQKKSNTLTKEIYASRIQQVYQELLERR